MTLARLAFLIAAALLAPVAAQPAPPAALVVKTALSYPRLGQFPAPRGKVFAIFTLEVNVSGQRVAFSPRSFRVAAGRASFALSEATFLLEEYCDDWGVLRPGARVRCQVAFELDAGVREGVLVLDTRTDGPARPLKLTAAFRLKSGV